MEAGVHGDARRLYRRRTRQSCHDLNPDRAHDPSRIRVTGARSEILDQAALGYDPAAGAT